MSIVTLSHALARLVEQDTFAEMLALLEPEELAVVALRLEGLSDAQIGALLDLDRIAVCWRIDQARLRIMQAMPELAVVLRDRRRPSQQLASQQVPPLERGWLCRWDRDENEPLHEEEAGLSTEDVAHLYGVTRSTVARWIRAGRFPHARRIGDGRGEYCIPEADLVGFRSGQRKSR
jgi:excisionase family DNA binding protein